MTGNSGRGYVPADVRNKRYYTSWNYCRFYLYTSYKKYYQVEPARVGNNDGFDKL